MFIEIVAGFIIIFLGFLCFIFYLLAKDLQEECDFLLKFILEKSNEQSKKEGTNTSGNEFLQRLADENLGYHFCGMIINILKNERR